MNYRTTIGTISLLLGLGLSTEALAADNSTVMIKDAWIREAPPNAQVLAAYFIVENHGDKIRRLVAVHAADFGSVEIHRTEHQNGMARMIKQDHVDIPVHGTIKFEPGGLHVMLITPKKRLLAGNHVELQLEFAGSEKTMVHAEVRKGSGGDHDMHHDHSPSHDNHQEGMIDKGDAKMHHDADHKIDMHEHKH